MMYVHTIMQYNSVQIDVTQTILNIFVCVFHFHYHNGIARSQPIWVCVIQCRNLY